MPVILTPAALPSLSQSAAMASYGVPYNQLMEKNKKKPQAWFTNAFMWNVGTTWKWTAAALQPLYGTFLKNSWKGKFSQCAEL